MGTGRGRGLDVWPDFRSYVLLGTFEDVEAARSFLDASPWMASYRRGVEEELTLWLEPVGGGGRWDGEEPFEVVAPGLDAAEPVAVLTRATVRGTAMPAFWRAASAVNRELARLEPPLSIGFGELPWVRQATFSLWPSRDAMEAFAYRSVAHRRAMIEARKHRWFAEDLFVRFRVLRSEGSWRGANPLPDLGEPPASGASRDVRGRRS